MSNPGVITLSDCSNRKGKVKRFVIEDNIGESIHLHIDNMRIDFTINEFLDFSKINREALKEIEILPGYSIDNFDEHFLLEIAHQLPKLKTIKIEEVRLSELNCIVSKKYRSLVLQKILPIHKTPVYRYLTGDTEDYKKYNQYNYYGINNPDRINAILQSIQENKYPYKDKYVVLTNGQNIIRDGQHRAAVLFHLYGGEHKIKIMRFVFDGSSHHINPLTINILRAIKWFILGVYRKLK
jgi:hypothetical protein